MKKAVSIVFSSCTGSWHISAGCGSLRQDVQCSYRSSINGERFHRQRQMEAYLRSVAFYLTTGAAAIYGSAVMNAAQDRRR